MDGLYYDILRFLYKHQNQEKDLYEEFEAKHKREAIKAAADELHSDELITRKIIGAGFHSSFAVGKKVKAVSRPPSNPKLLAKILWPGIQKVDELNVKLNPPSTRPHKITIRFAYVMAGIALFAMIGTYVLNPTFQAFVNRQFQSEQVPSIPPSIDITKDKYGFAAIHSLVLARKATQRVGQFSP